MTAKCPELFSPASTGTRTASRHAGQSATVSGWRMNRRPTRWAAGISLLVVLAAASCAGGTNSSTTVPTAGIPGTSGVQVSEHSWHDPNMRLTTVNGQTPPGTATFAKEQHDAVNTRDTDGSTVLTHLTVRAAGTRSPVHVHENGGTTCIMQGEMTLYLEGAEPHRALAGECYYMPAQRAMSGFNSGTVDATMFDSFVLPKNAPEWVNLELDESGQPPTSG